MPTINPARRRARHLLLAAALSALALPAAAQAANVEIKQDGTLSVVGPPATRTPWRSPATAAGPSL